MYYQGGQTDCLLMAINGVRYKLKAMRMEYASRFGYKDSMKIKPNGKTAVYIEKGIGAY